LSLMVSAGTQKRKNPNLW